MNTPVYNPTMLFLGSSATFDAHSESDRRATLTFEPDRVQRVTGVWEGDREHTAVLTYSHLKGPAIAREAAWLARATGQAAVLVVRPYNGAISDPRTRVSEVPAISSDVSYTDWNGTYYSAFIPNPNGNLTAYLIDRDGHLSTLDA